MVWEGMYFCFVSLILTRLLYKREINFKSQVPLFLEFLIDVHALLYRCVKKSISFEWDKSESRDLKYLCFGDTGTMREPGS